MDQLAEALMDKEKIDGAEFEAIMKGEATQKVEEESAASENP